MVEGLYSGLSSGAALSSTQLDVKMKLLVEAPAAVEDALASLLDHHDATLQVGSSTDAGSPSSLSTIFQDGVQPVPLRLPAVLLLHPAPTKTLHAVYVQDISRWIVSALMCCFACAEPGAADLHQAHLLPLPAARAGHPQGLPDPGGLLGTHAAAPGRHAAGAEQCQRGARYPRARRAAPGPAGDLQAPQCAPPAASHPSPTCASPALAHSPIPENVLLRPGGRP